MVEPIPFLQTHGQQFQQGRNIQTAHQAYDGSSLPRLSRAQDSAHSLQSPRAQFLDQSNQAVAFVTLHAAEEAVRQVLDRGFGSVAQNPE